MNFFQNLFGSYDFDELPNATLNKEGFVLESNDLFKKYFTNSNDLRLKDIIKSKTIDNKVICVKDGYQWTMVHKNIARDRYKVWLVPEVEDAPSVWNLINIPMIWIDKMFEIKYTNSAYVSKFGKSVGDFVTKYCQNFLGSMLVNGESRELIWNKKLCKITFYKKSEELYLLMLRDDFKNEKLDNGDNLHSIGQVTSAVVHDFRNILSVINGYCELLIEEKDNLKDDCINYVTQIHSTVSSASTMVKELLKFTKAQINTDVSTCLYDVLFNMRHVINKLVGSDIHTKFNFEDKIGHVGLSVVDLERIIVNMIINAKDAMKDEGIIEISILKKYFDKNWKVNDCHLRAGFYLVLRFEDSGSGIKPENHEKIFSPFFTTKKNGNGLGLSTIISILKDVSGGIQFFSSGSKGTRFDLYMPIVQGINKSTPKTALDSLVNGNVKSKNKKILLVEDNPDVLKICSIVLEKEGYTIVKYDNADEAINYIAKNDSIDLLVTDANLPGKSGAELAIEFKKFFTNGKIIVISGFDQDKIGQYFPRESVFMSKPLALSDFTKKVNNILNKL